MDLAELDVLVVDCQAAGATPAHGDLLELGWGVCTPGGLRGGARAHWIRPQSERPVSRIVRELTGFDESYLPDALEPRDAWSRLCADASSPQPTIIHWARFELPFLRQLHDDAELPLDVVCLHAVAERLFPDLARRNLRALAGHLGFSPQLVRRAAGHVEASAFIWRALVPRLADRNVRTWDELAAFVRERKPARPAKRVFSLGAERRRALPTTPGVYRFLRSNGDVLYVGKASNLRRRVTSHFTGANSAKKTGERSLEMLTQVHDVAFTAVGTPLEAALLECDEIKRLEPPYNVQLALRSQMRRVDREDLTGTRRAWFATRTFDDARDAPGAEHPIGPLPSSNALGSLAAIRRLALGGEVTTETAAAAVGVPLRFAPPLDLFGRAFAALDPGTDVLAAARARWPLAEDDEDDDEDDEWTEARVLRALERALVNGGLLVRRARWLSVLVAAHVVFREPGSEQLVELAPAVPERSRLARQRAFDAALYDRTRVLSTELRRVLTEGGDVRVTLLGRRIDARAVYAVL